LKVYPGGSIDVFNRTGNLIAASGLFFASSLHLADHAGDVLCRSGNEAADAALFPGSVAYLIGQLLHGFSGCDYLVAPHSLLFGSIGDMIYHFGYLLRGIANQLAASGL